MTHALMSVLLIMYGLRFAFTDIFRELIFITLQSFITLGVPVFEISKCLVSFYKNYIVYYNFYMLLL